MEDEKYINLEETYLKQVTDFGLKPWSKNYRFFQYLKLLSERVQIRPGYWAYRDPIWVANILSLTQAEIRRYKQTIHENSLSVESSS